MPVDRTFAPLRTKLFLPVVRSDYLLRERLYTHLEHGRQGRLILASAPAGFGKTTLLSAWLRQLDDAVIWLTLDELDNDLVRLISYLVAGADDVETGRMQRTEALLSENQPFPVERWVAALIDDYLAWGRTIHLALDDLHVMHDRIVLSFLQRLVERLPSNLHLVIAARTDPLLPLTKMRVAHEIIELRAEHLRFSPDEAYVYLSDALGAAPSASVTEEVVQQTEGWIAGLRLLVLAAQGSSTEETTDRIIDQTHHFAVHYLVNEVLIRQPAHVREFLLVASLCERFCAALIAALTGQSIADCRAVLESLTQSDLFLVQLDSTREWFRFHQLFQAALQSELFRLSDESALTSYHVQASAWFAERSLLGEAIYHALAAQDLDQAVALVEAGGQNYLNGIERRQLENWLAALPADAVWNRPKLLIAKAWLYYRHWRVDELGALLDQLRTMVVRPADARPASGVGQGHLFTLQTMIDMLYVADCTQIIETGRAAVTALPKSERGARALALSGQSVGLFMQGKVNRAFALLDAALADPAPNSPAEIQLYLGRCTLCEFAGDFTQMEQTAQRFRSAAGTDRPFMAAAQWMSGRAWFETDQLDQALDAFAVTIANADATNFFAAATAMLKSAQIHQARGEFDAAQATLTQALDEGIRLRNRVLHPLLEAAQATLWLETCDRDRALQWAQSVRPGLDPVGGTLFDSVLLSWARLCLLSGHEELTLVAYERLQDGLAHVEALHLPHRRFSFRLLLAAFDAALGNHVAARNALPDLILLIQSGRFVRSVLDFGIGLAPDLLKYELPQPLAIALSRTTPSDRLTSTPSPSPSPMGSTRRAGSMQNGADLTRREEEILRLMQDGNTNQEIANELVISVSTVKRHATNIYTKLAVRNRRQAVRTAIAAGLLPPLRPG